MTGNRSKNTDYSMFISCLHKQRYMVFDLRQNLICSFLIKWFRLHWLSLLATFLSTRVRPSTSIRTGDPLNQKTFQSQIYVYKLTRVVYCANWLLLWAPRSINSHILDLFCVWWSFNCINIGFTICTSLDLYNMNLRQNNLPFFPLQFMKCS